LTIVDGPPLLFTVFDGCSSGVLASEAFTESQVCAFGSCNIWIPSYAKHSTRSTFYVTLESRSLIGSTAVTDPTGTITRTDAEFTRNTNIQTEKTTAYTLSVVLGTANCAAPPSTGFCADPTQEGVDVWSSISNPSVWSYIRPDLKDQEAQCRFEELIQSCVYPSPDCRQWLKILSCLESFPQCDALGFQQGTCRAVCQQVQSLCGPFLPVNSHYEFSCCTDKYQNGTAGTCYTIPPPPPPPPAITPAVGKPASALPPPIEVPVFTTIFAYLPPGYGVAGEKEAEFIREGLPLNSSSSSLLPSLIVFLLTLVVLF